MKKVLVVGGAGYVGCVLVEELLAKGYSVRVFDRLFFGRDHAGEFLDRVELVVEDMRDFNESHVEDCGAVINIGGLSNDPTAEFNPKANEELNTHASIKVAEVAKKAGVPRLIFASTCSIYDRGVGEEVRDLLLDEDSEVDPKAAYATSKLAAEQAILAMADDDFVPVSFRKGTIFGFSARMRYDLVVNAFVKDALMRGKLSVHYGGAMWRPLIDVKDVARAYVMALDSDADLIRGQIFNLSAGNFRISELALRVQRALQDLGVQAELDVDFSYRLVRSYRVSGDKILKTLGFQPRVTVEESVAHMVEQIERHGFTDFSHPRYYNIEWMKLLESAVETVSTHGYVLSKPEWGDRGLEGERARLLAERARQGS
ncbi:MAG: SDR family oxidoreductase [Actinobacteria bacterium]|nr:SDR family oxidoreductase [Actinomycetota bacterium]